MTTTLDRPPMIRTDNNDFARHALEVRAPAVIDDILARNPDYPTKIQQALQQLQRSITNNDPVPVLEPIAPDYVTWKTVYEDYYASDTWLSTEWFFAETYFYRHVVQAVRWYETLRDPFAPNKEEEYQSQALWDVLRPALNTEGAPEQRVMEALSRALWGNRIDLSYAESRVHGTSVKDDDLIVNDSQAAARHLISGDGIVHLITDNAGTELVMDLALVDVLLSSTSVDRVVLHMKMHPTFVSDAMPVDVWRFLQHARARGEMFSAFAERLQSAFDAGQIRLIPNLYWNSPHPLWKLWSNLKYGAFWNARMVIVKGDANYRRTVGDAIWPPDVPFSYVTDYFPAPLLALRTLKSDPVVGLPGGLAEKLDKLDARWRYNGKRGLIQYKG
ncbi:MAG: damage-control phosphatase ARMT1 family protein [Anaerolineae bacterium]